MPDFEYKIWSEKMSIINAKTEVCGLIGNPVGHSISPLIHNTISEKMNINLSYVTFRVDNDKVMDAVKGAYALNIKGLNVTVPHKQAAAECVVDIDQLARAIGAVNTLVRVENGFKGYNTDYIGLKRQMEEDGVAIYGEEIIIIGAGGAARAVVFMCANEEAKKIYLLNRSLDNAKKLADDVNSYVEKDVVVPMELADYVKLEKKKYNVIQTTSKGMYPDVDGVPIEDEEFYDLIKNAVDIIFNPGQTSFMKRAAMHGAKVYNGLRMLLYQGVASYELWNNVKVSDEHIKEVYELMKREMVQ